MRYSNQLRLGGMLTERGPEKRRMGKKRTWREREEGRGRVLCCELGERREEGNHAFKEGVCSGACVWCECKVVYERRWCVECVERRVPARRQR